MLRVNILPGAALLGQAGDAVGSRAVLMALGLPTRGLSHICLYQAVSSLKAGSLILFCFF